MARYITIFLLVAIGTALIDYNLKILAMESVNGVEYATILKGSCIDLELHYNKGVAFSMFAFLGDNLKWIQLLLISGIVGFVLYEGYIKEYTFPIGLIVGGAVGNLYDRFVYEGVVDYVAWHCGFNFAVFNYADVMIDLGVGLILLFTFLEKKSR
jgi:signal peptidase II